MTHKKLESLESVMRRAFIARAIVQPPGGFESAVHCLSHALDRPDEYHPDIME